MTLASFALGFAAGWSIGSMILLVGALFLDWRKHRKEVQQEEKQLKLFSENG